MTLAVARAVFAKARKLAPNDAIALATAARILDRTPEGLAALLGLDRLARDRPPRPQAGQPKRVRVKPPGSGPGPARRETCARGHSLADAIVRRNGSRTCRTCHAEAVKRWDAKRPPRPRRTR